MVRQVNIHEAKTHFSELIAAVERGEEIIIARRGKPVARVSGCAARPAKGGIKLGFFEGLAREVDPDWWKPIPDEEIREMFGDEFADAVGVS
jgi:prevent-host-death family protein